MADFEYSGSSYFSDDLDLIADLEMIGSVEQPVVALCTISTVI